MSPAIIIPTVLFCSVFGVAVVAILSKAFTDIACHWRDVSLKTRMVEAGYSAAEIERVVSTRPGGGSRESEMPPIRKPLPAAKMTA